MRRWESRGSFQNDNGRSSSICLSGIQGSEPECMTRLVPELRSTSHTVAARDGCTNIPLAAGSVTGGAFPRKVGGGNSTVTAGRRPWWPRMAGLQPLSTRAFGPRLRRLTALTALATRPLIATKRSTARCGQSVCKCHAEKFRSAIFARILTAVHTGHDH